MLDRTDRSLIGIWWWTVDRWLLASALLLMVDRKSVVLGKSVDLGGRRRLKKKNKHFSIKHTNTITLFPLIITLISVHSAATCFDMPAA